MRLVALADHLSSYCVYDAAPDAVRGALMARLGDPGISAEVTGVRQLADWDGYLAELIPLGSFPTKYFLGSMESRTVLVSNCGLGAPHELAGPLSERLSCTAAFVVATERCRQWFVFDTGRRMRAINCQQDGGRWIFEARGRMESYEQPEHYAARLKRARLTPSMVMQYCVARFGFSKAPNLREVFAAQSFVIATAATPKMLFEVSL